MANPALWSAWPYLPLVRRHGDGRTDYGVLFDAQAMCQLSGYRCTVWIANLFLLPPTLEQFLALPHETHDTLDEVYGAGWRVD
jgi:hypothetical protein